MGPTEFAAEAVKIALLMLMGLSLFGLIVPAFPGLFVMWALTLVYGLLFGFEGVGIWMFLLVSALTVIGSLADNVLMGREAHRGGASLMSIGIALVAGFVGSFLLTPLGGILVTLVALFLSEYAIRKDPNAAWTVTRQMAIGWGWSFVIRVIAGVLIIIFWGIWAWA